MTQSVIVKDHYRSRPKIKRKYRIIENQLTILNIVVHDWDEDKEKIIRLWRDAHRINPDACHEIYVMERDGVVHGLCQLKSGECSRGIPEHDLSCEECDSYKRIDDKVRCQELYTARATK